MHFVCHIFVRLYRGNFALHATVRKLLAASTSVSVLPLFITHVVGNTVLLGNERKGDNKRMEKDHRDFHDSRARNLLSYACTR